MEGIKLTVDYFRNELSRNENSLSPDDASLHSFYYLSQEEESKLKKNTYTDKIEL